MIIDSPIVSGSFLSTGSLSQIGNAQITGSLTVSGSSISLVDGSFSGSGANLFGIPATGITGLNLSQIASGSVSASISPDKGLLINTSVSASNFTGSFTGSLIGIATSASYAAFALTSSYSLGGSGFPFSGSAVITGSLIVSGSRLTITGSLAVSTLSTGSGVRYVIADQNGLISAQTASAAIFTTQQNIATAGQTVFPIVNGYVTDYLNVFVNGTKLNNDEFTDTDGVNVIFLTGSTAGDIVEFQRYLPAAGVTNNALRQINYFTTTLGQTTFTVNYTPGLVDVFYNGAKLDNTEYTAANGTSITLATGSNAGDTLEVDVYSYQVGAFSGIGGSGAANQLAYYNTSNSITGSRNFSVSGSSIIITGSLIVSGSGTLVNIGPAIFSGSVTSTSGFTGSFSGNADSASLAANSLLLGGTGSVGFATTSSFATASGSISTRVTQIEQVYATTGSNSFRATQSITGSLTVTGQIIAQTINVQQVTSSIIYSSGSNVFGCDLNSRQTFTGSVLVTGSFTVNTTGPELQVNSNGVILGNLLTDNHSITGSLRINGILCSSGAITGSSIIVNPSGTGFITVGASNSYGYIGSPNGGATLYLNGPTRGGSLTAASCAMVLATDGDIYFTNGLSNSYKMFVSGSGFIGINTVTPTSLLEIQQNQNAQTGFRVRNSTSGTGASVEVGLYTNSGNGGIGKYSTSTSTYKNIIAGTTYIYNGSSGDIGLLNDASSGNISFAAGGASSAQMFISASGFTGINTITPSSLLHINTARSSGADVNILTLSDNVTGVQTSGFGVRILATSNNGQAKSALAFEQDGGTNNDTAIAFYTQTSAACLAQRMIIDKNGTIRVNSLAASTNYKFGVAGSAYVNGSNNKGIFITDNATYASIVGLNSAISAYNPVELRASGTDYQLYLNTNGNVGVTTNDPKANFHVCGSTAVLRVGPWFSTNDRDYIELIANGLNTQIVSPNEFFSILNPAGCIDIISSGSGGVRLTPGATSWTGISDRRKKKNFETTQGLAELLQIEPVKYHFEWDNDCLPKRLGFIAQNIQPLIPEMVKEMEEAAESCNRYLTITPDYILPVLVKSIQEQHCVICSQASTINALKTCLGII